MDKFDPELLAQIADNFIGGFCVFSYNSDTKAVDLKYVNDGFFRMLSVSKPAGMMLINNAAKVIIPDDLPLMRQWLKDVIADNGSAEEEIRFVTLDGQLSWLSLRGNLYERNGKDNTIVCTLLDITERKMIEEEFRNQYEFMNKLMDIGVNFDYNVRTDVCEMRAGKDWIHEGNFLVDHYLEKVENSGIYPEDMDLFIGNIKRAMKKPIQDTFEYRAVAPFTKSDDYKWYKCNIMSIMGQEGYVSHVLGLVSDINDQKLEEIELKLRADKDSLTGLLNKGATTELINKYIEDLSANSKKGALILLDVDDFKNINDTYGHMTGDDVLAAIGKALLKNFKGMDVVGRIGGDEFMVFMGDIKDIKDAESMAEKLQKDVKNQCTREEARNILSISMGIAEFPAHGKDYESLYATADQALYQSKGAGKARYSVYIPE